LDKSTNFDVLIGLWTDSSNFIEIIVNTLLKRRGGADQRGIIQEAIVLWNRWGDVFQGAK
jgi:hypothetical protein